MTRLLPTADWTRALLAPALVFIATGIDRNYQTDFWHHLARGRATAADGALLDEDRFTYTVPGKPFQDANWLSQLLYHGLFERGGLPLVHLVNSLTLAAMMAVLVALSRRASGSLWLAAAVGAGTFFGLWQVLILRPQTFSLLLFVLLYGALELAEARRAWLLAVPPVMALWANLHGGFPVGLALVGCFAAAGFWEAGRVHGWRAWRDRNALLLALCLAASVVATFANPYGPRVYDYVRLTSTVAGSRPIDEWLPPGLGTLVGKVWVASVLLVVVLFALPGRRPSSRQVILVLCFLPPACGSVRMVAWWLLAVAPVAANLLAAKLPRAWLTDAEPERPSFAAAAAFLLLLGSTALCAPPLERYNPLFAHVRSPHRTEDDLESAARQLQERLGEGRVFTRFAWGEYLGWRLNPHFTVFMDGRIEIFPDAVWAEYSAVTRGRGDWQAVLDHYRVDALLLDTQGYHGNLLPQVEHSPVWERAGGSGDAVLFVRRRASDDS